MQEAPAYVLHSRPYKESSALVDFLTPHGRVCAVMRRARNRHGSLIRPFAPLQLRWQGRNELKTVTQLEPLAPLLWLEGQWLYSGLYLNELLVRLLLPEAEQPTLFEDYALALQGLVQKRPLEPLLRGFEWSLLQGLGYGLALDQDHAGHLIQPASRYRLQPDLGFVRVADWSPGIFTGEELLALQQPDWSSAPVLQTAKRLMRQALAPLLKGRPLASRELFIQHKEFSRD